MTRIMIVGAGPLQLAAYEEAQRMGLQTVAIDRDPAAPGMALATSAHVVDTRDAAAAVEVARREQIQGVLTLCTDFPMQTVAAVNEALGLSGLRPLAAQRATHKGEMRAALEAAGVPIPRYQRVHTAREAARAVEQIGCPAIIKPPEASGSRGVYKLETHDDVSAGYEHALAVAGAEEVLVEAFIEGPEVSVETVSFQGHHHVVTVTDKRTTGDPHWVELGHVQPAALPSSTWTAVEQVTRQGLDALGIMESTSHAELKIGPWGPVVIEIGARLGGDFITTELVPRSTGVNMVRAAIELALGRRPDLSPQRAQGAAIRYIWAAPGPVVAVHGVERAAQLPGVVRLEVSATVGERVDEVQASGDRPGFVIAEGPDAESAEATSSEAVSLIRIETGED